MAPLERRAIVIGGGPAGLMAAEVLSENGIQVDLYDAMPSVGRKFLLAGKGGMNLTHAEAAPDFLARYADRQMALSPAMQEFDAVALRAWCAGLNIQTFVGSSGRVFPTDMKAAPLLRAWLHRLRNSGVRFHMRHRWLGWDDAGALRFAHQDQIETANAQAVILALGGASWARLGSDGAWVPWLRTCGIDVASLAPANCGFETQWSAHFIEKFAGAALKSIAIRWTDADGRVHAKIGECIVTAFGLEGSLIYAMSAELRTQIRDHGCAEIEIDLTPAKSAERVLAEVAHPRGARSLSSHLQSRVGLSGVKAGLLNEILTREAMRVPQQLATAIKALPITLRAPRPIDEAISSAGGVRFEALDTDLMCNVRPGVFCAGEMLDWEAPTGGYLLNACMATGRHAARGALRYLTQFPEP